jgi:hypothetical protein
LKGLVDGRVRRLFKDEEPDSVGEVIEMEYADADAGSIRLPVFGVIEDANLEKPGRFYPKGIR